MFVSHTAASVKLASLTLLASFALASHAAAVPHTPGTLANPGFEGQPMKSMLFVPGQWRGLPGEAFYAGPDPGAPPLAPAGNRAVRISLGKQKLWVTTTAFSSHSCSTTMGSLSRSARSHLR